eukprot:659167-Rhodomonas_salina.4
MQAEDRYVETERHRSWLAMFDLPGSGLPDDGHQKYQVQVCERYSLCYSAPDAFCSNVARCRLELCNSEPEHGPGAVTSEEEDRDAGPVPWQKRRQPLSKAVQIDAESGSSAGAGLWIPVASKSTGSTYWFSPSTGVTQWTKPA